MPQMLPSWFLSDPCLSLAASVSVCPFPSTSCPSHHRRTLGVQPLVSFRATCCTLNLCQVSLLEIGMLLESTWIRNWGSGGARCSGVNERVCGSRAALIGVLKSEVSEPCTDERTDGRGRAL